MPRLAILILIGMAVACGTKDVSVALEEYYPPTVYSDVEYLSVSIPVEISNKDGKQSFVELFEKYGFSGNGPSIEQVVKKNTDTSSVEFDSEGDAFVAYSKSKADHARFVSEIKCIEKIECLNGWLKNARFIGIKE